MEYLKWDIGIRNLEYFTNYGNQIIDNKFIVDSVGFYTVYYKTPDDIYRIYSFYAREGSMPPSLVEPVITIDGAKFQISFDESNKDLISDTKYDIGQHDIEYFENNGTPFDFNDQVTVTEEGLYTLCYKYANTYYIKEFTIDEIPIVSDEVYTIVMDTNFSSMSNPFVYKDDALNFTEATYDKTTNTFNWNSWEDKFPFNQIKPCVIKNGTVQYYLNPNDYTQKDDGSPSVITGADGDVMIEFPKIYWKIKNVGTNINELSISEKAIDSDFKAYAFMRGSTEFNKLYIGAYPSTTQSGTSTNRSMSGASPTHKTFAEHRTFSKYTNPLYEQYTIQSHTLLQVLFLFLFRKTEKNYLGEGHFPSSGSANGFLTGMLNDKGLFYGTASKTDHVKFLGLESFYIKYGFFLDGIRTPSSSVSIGNENFNNSGTGYRELNMFIPSSSGNVNAIMLDPEAIFVSKAGSEGMSWDSSFTPRLSDKTFCFCGSSSSFEGVFQTTLDDLNKKSRLTYLSD